MSDIKLALPSVNGVIDVLAAFKTAAAPPSVSLRLQDSDVTRAHTHTCSATLDAFKIAKNKSRVTELRRKPELAVEARPGKATRTANTSSSSVLALCKLSFWVISQALNV